MINLKKLIFTILFITTVANTSVECLNIKINKEEAKKALNNFASKMDKAASKGIFKGNTASRKISRLMKRLNSLNKA